MTNEQLLARIREIVAAQDHSSSAAEDDAVVGFGMIRDLLASADEPPAKPSPYRVEIRCGKCNALIPHDPRVVLREIVCPNGCGALGTKP